MWVLRLSCLRCLHYKNCNYLRVTTQIQAKSAYSCTSFSYRTVLRVENTFSQYRFMHCRLPWLCLLSISSQWHQSSVRRAPSRYDLLHSSDFYDVIYQVMFICRGIVNHVYLCHTPLSEQDSSHKICCIN